jgi:hypothetical protein
MNTLDKSCYRKIEDSCYSILQLYADFYIASKKTYSYDEYNRFYEEVFNKMERDIIHKAIRSINELEMVVKNELND